MPWSVAIMVVMIVLISAIAKTQKARYLAQSQQQPVQSADAMRAAEEVRLLKERVAVLERVVTDNHGSLGLDREIERLRDR